MHNDFNETDDFIRFFIFTYSFVEINVDVSYEGNSHLSKLIDKSKPEGIGSNKKAILIF